MHPHSWKKKTLENLNPGHKQCLNSCNVIIGHIGVRWDSVSSMQGDITQGKTDASPSVKMMYVYIIYEMKNMPIP